MKKTRLGFVIMFILFGTASCSYGNTVISWGDNLFKSDDDQGGTEELDLLPKDVTEQWQEDINQINALYDAQSIPSHLIEDNPSLQGTEFDVMAVFDILDHISMEEGYRLFYVYDYDFMGGRPVLYSLKEGETPYSTFAEYTDHQANCLKKEEEVYDCNYLQHLKSDGTELGYLELITLYLMGNQFYLYWHADYNDSIFIATDDAIDALIENLTEPYISMTLLQKTQARRIDPTPEIVFDGENVIISAVWFTKWGGFYQSDFTISQNFPHTIQVSPPENLLEYDCQIMF